jgi:hypothetical protein
MKHRNEFENRTTRGILPLAGATALAAALTISSAQPAHADEITPPDVPAQLAVNDGSRPFLKGRGVGTQNYVCLPSGSGFDWNLFTPEAVLLDVDGSQLTTHFFGPNPDENRTIRAAWRDSRDTSTVWGAAVATAISQTDPRFVAKNAIPLGLCTRFMGEPGGTTVRFSLSTSWMPSRRWAMARL